MFIVFFAYSPSDWFVKMRLWRFPAIGNQKKSAKVIDFYHLSLNGLQKVGSLTAKKTCNLGDLNCVRNVSVVFCINFEGWIEFGTKVLLEIHRHLL